MHNLVFKVHIYDTDCYGVMWHGNYAIYLEQARDAYMDAVGLPLQMPGEGHIYPVAEQTLRYRKPARLRDVLEVQTEVDLKGPRVQFTQQIVKLDEAGEHEYTVIEALTSCVVCDAQFKPFRRVPEEIRAMIEAAAQAEFVTTTV